MHIPSLLLGLAASTAVTVSAIDIRLWYRNNQCKDTINVKCIGTSPNTCCGPVVANVYASIGFGPVPSRWRISMRGHTAQGCGPVKQTVEGVGPNDNLCINDGAFSGGGYSVISTGKRDEDDILQLDRGEPKCVKADTIGVNGTDVSIQHLSADEQTELLMWARHATDLSTIEDKIARIISKRK